MTVRRQYTFALLAGAVGAGLIWLALREQWAQAVFTQPRPLPRQTVSVSGTDLVPLAGALAIAALAGLAAIIATRGLWRRVAGALVALFGAGTGAAVMTTVTASTVVSVAASHVASPESAMSGTAGSTTSGSRSGTAVVLAGSGGHAVMGGTSWQILVLAGALLVFAAGLGCVLRGADWPVMSSKYDSPSGRAASQAGPETVGPDSGAGPETAAAAAGPRDSASMWESLSGGDDPTG